VKQVIKELVHIIGIILKHESWRKRASNLTDGIRYLCVQQEVQVDVALIEVIHANIKNVDSDSHVWRVIERGQRRIGG
jgi:hypothetical protein